MWISAEAPPPTTIVRYEDCYESDYVLATDGRTILVANFIRDEGYGSLTTKWVILGRDGYEFDNVTHWMPLPALPCST